MDQTQPPQTPTPKPTPGPWTIAVTARVLCEPCMADIADDEGVEVATGVRYKHAVHVLRCVNSHDRLIKALELALDYYRSHGTGKFNPYQVEQALEQALALARATG